MSMCVRLTSLLSLTGIQRAHSTDSLHRLHTESALHRLIYILRGRSGDGFSGNLGAEGPGCGAFWSRRIAKYVERPDYFGASRIPSEGFLRAWDFFARSPWRGDADRGFRTRNFARIPCASRNVVGECSLLRLALLAE